MDTAIPTGNLIVEESRGADDAVFYAAKWRASLDRRQMKRRLGPAWLEPDGQGGWRPRKGRVKPDYLDPRRAHVRMAEIIADCELADAERAERAAAHEQSHWTFGKLAEAWLDHAENVRGLKPSTLRDLRSVLAQPGTKRRRGSGDLKARLMTKLGDVPAAEVIVDDIEDYLRSLSEDGASGRTINRHREILRAIFNFGATPTSGFKLRSNPAAESDLRREEGASALEVFTVEQVEQLALCAGGGQWRSALAWDRTEETRAYLREQDAQLADLLRIACYCGLRRGELVLLKWEDVQWKERVLVVRRALSDGVEVLPKSGRSRHVPLGDQALAALKRLSKRGDFTGPDDYVFINDVGGWLDPSALRRRYVRVREKAQLPRLRFHDLRHTAGSLLARVMDPASVKEILGHADLATTERYLHAQRASLLAGAATRAFAPATPLDREAEIADALLELTPDQRAGLRRRLDDLLAVSAS